jgi:hypothetical protein
VKHKHFLISALNCRTILLRDKQNPQRYRVVVVVVVVEVVEVVVSAAVLAVRVVGAVLFMHLTWFRNSPPPSNI